MKVRMIINYFTAKCHIKSGQCQGFQHQQQTVMLELNGCFMIILSTKKRGMCEGIILM